MKIKEFVEKVNEHDGMRAKKVYKRIAIGTPNNMGIFSIPEDATNFIEIDTWATSNSLYWKKEDREYLSALIEEFLHTPVEERFPEKQKNCPYCHEKGAEHYVKMIQDIPGCGMGLMLRNDGWHIWTSLRLTYVGSLKPINYCPECGRSLNEEEE